MPAMFSPGPGGTQGGELDVGEQRRLIRSLLVPDDPSDGMAAYYALEYDPRRVRLTLHRARQGSVDGFAAVCQTGQELFVPLVIVRCPPEAVRGLLQQAVHPGRPCRTVTTPSLRDAVRGSMDLEWERVNSIYVLDARAYHPVLNVLVQPGRGPHRFEIRVRGEIASAAGVNWRSARLAEMYVYTEPTYRRRGWGQAVGAACVRSLLEAGSLPLYTVLEDRGASHSLAHSIGFRDRGAREFECRGVLRL